MLLAAAACLILWGCGRYLPDRQWLRRVHFACERQNLAFLRASTSVVSFILDGRRSRGGCDGIVVNPPPHLLYIAFSLLSRSWVQILHLHSVGPLPAPNSGAPRCLLLPNFNFYLENSIFNLRTFIHLL